MNTDQHNHLQAIEEAYITIGAHLELLNAKTPDQSLFKHNLQLSVITLSREGGTVHQLRKAFEDE